MTISHRLASLSPAVRIIASASARVARSAAADRTRKRFRTLLALLFVGGVTNLIWIAMLTLIVLAEKLLPAGAMAGKLLGGLLIVWAVATLLV